MEGVLGKYEYNVDILQDPLAVAEEFIKREIMDEDGSNMLEDQEAARFHTEMLFVGEDVSSKIKNVKKKKHMKKRKIKKKKKYKYSHSRRTDEYNNKETIDSLLTNEGTQDVQGVWSCNRCQKPFSVARTLLHHLRRVHKVLGQAFEFRCNVCDKDFLNQHALRLHKVRLHSEVASLVKERKESIRDILIREGVQNEENMWICNTCQKPFNNDKTFSYHLRRAHNLLSQIFNHRCKICGKDFLNSDSLRVHRKRVHLDEGKDVKLKDIITNQGVQDDQGVWNCNICQKPFNTEKTFTHHLRRAHSLLDEAFGFRCNMCDKDFMNRESLSLHKSRSHSDISLSKERKQNKLREVLLKAGVQDETGQWMCKRCPRPFSTDKNFVHHLRRKHDMLENLFIYSCSTCNKDFLTNEALQRHKSRMHCSDTSQEYDNENSKEISLKEGFLDHQGLWICNRCHDSFGTKEIFVDHLKTSHNLPSQDFKCSVCRKDFPNLNALILHKRRIHKQGSVSEDYKSGKVREMLLKEGTQDANACWTCNRCQIPFTMNKNFIYHLRRKHNLLGQLFYYKCDECGKDFLSSDTLQKHKSRLHALGDDIEEISQCDGISNAVKHFCFECSKEYPSLKALQKHRRLSHAQGSVNEECRSGKLRDVLLKEGTQDDVGGWICKTCQRPYKNFVNHLRRKHNLLSQVYEHKCTMCDRDFVTADSLRKHKIYTHLAENGSEGFKKDKIRDTLVAEGTQDEKGVWTCNRCLGTFNLDNTFVHHLRRVHDLLGQVFGFLCTICNKDFLTMEALHSHGKRVHVDTRPPSDSLRDNLFNEGYQDDEGVWICNRCQEPFSTEKGFIKHLVIKHKLDNETSQHRCTTCDKSFSSYKNLQEHVNEAHPMKVDTEKNSLDQPQSSSKNIEEILEGHGKKDRYGNWLCNDCGDMFETKAQLMKHLKRIHNVELEADY